MARIEKTVFISYRRKDISWALAVYQYLASQKYDVFFDYTHIPSGDFEQIIVSNIKARAHFILILTPNALDRTNNEGDWLRREIETAIDEKRNIIPLFFDGFSFGSPNVKEKLTGKMGNISRYNGLDVPSGYFPEAMERLSTRYLNTPLDAVIHPVSIEVRKRSKEEKVAANKALREQKTEIKELVRPAKKTTEKKNKTPVEKADDSHPPLKIHLSDKLRLGEAVGPKPNLRPFATGAGILLIAMLGVMGIRALINNSNASDNSKPTLTSAVVAESTSTSISPVPTNTKTDDSATLVSTDQSQDAVTYTVQPGDTLALIALKYGVSIDEIITANGLENANTIQVDQVLLIPVSQVTPTPELSIGSSIIGKDGMKLLYVPAGEFSMGSEDGGIDEKPIHTVYLDAFWIDRTEITNAMYAMCVNDGVCNEPSSKRSYTRNNYYGKSEFVDYPVIYVSWDHANSYCEWADRRLPTEAEWEKAARGENAFTYPWGNEIDCSLANYSAKDGMCVGDTTEVGIYPDGSSPYGALDMAGNVWEWVNDWYDSSYYQSSPPSNPQGPSSGQYRVVRGGAWLNSNDYVVRSARRDWGSPEFTFVNFSNVGFRCAMDAE